MTTPHPNAEHSMVTLRVVRHDQHEHLLADCASAVVPARGEIIQLDTLDAHGEQFRPSTMWRVVSVTLHIPSVASQQPADASTLAVSVVEVSVLPDGVPSMEMAAAAANRLSESER